MIERVEFTPEMKKDYTILFPSMAPIHFELLGKVFQQYGYRTELLSNQGDAVVQEGLKYVHNDTCYPALLVIGQMIDALKSGRYDLNKTALLITQTGGGCRASNYIFLLRKALKRAGMEQIPVISLNFSGLEKNSGFKLSLSLILKAFSAIVFADEMMALANQTRPYEVHKGETDQLVNEWIEKLSGLFQKRKALFGASMRKVFSSIASDFSIIECENKNLVKVGIVGEIYVKYAKLGNNNLEDFLHEQNCEVNVPGMIGFVLYCVDNMIRDIDLYGGSVIKQRAIKMMESYLYKVEKSMHSAIEESGRFHAPAPFEKLKEMGEEIIGMGCKMGEGWLLPAEMVELVRSGYVNVICTQPFGCLPNHIAGKGMIRKIREKYPESNIVPIDYDPGATRVNQENRIKLMLSVGRESVK